MEFGSRSFHAEDFKEEGGEWPERDNEEILRNPSNYLSSQGLGCEEALTARTEGKSALGERF